MMILGRHVAVPQMGRQVFAARGTVAAAANWFDVAGVTCIAAYRAKGAASYAASLVNLANPGTYDAVAGSAPGWDAGVGWTFAASEWLSLGGLPYVALDWTILVRATAAVNTQYIFSSYNASSQAAIHLVASNRLKAQVGNSTLQELVSVDPTYTDKVFGAAGAVGYFDGAEANTITGTSAITADRAAIGANWPGYGPYNQFTGTIMALAIWSSVLSEAQIGTLTTAMAAL